MTPLGDDDLVRRLGIFARTFTRASPGEVADAVAAAGYRMAHWNFAAIGRPTLADDVGDQEIDDVRQAFHARGVAVPSASATFNAIHPDEPFRAKQTARAAAYLSRVPRLGAEVVTLCTGTRHPTNMWAPHPGNTSASAWRDLRATLDVLLEAAETAGVLLGVEPEPGNVVCDATAAATLLAEVGEAPIGIVLDPANLLTPATVARQHEVVAEAIDLLGPRVVGVQVKDVVDDGYCAAGQGQVDYPALFRQLGRLAPVPWIVQDAAEDDAARVRDDVARWYAAAGDH